MKNTKDNEELLNIFKEIYFEIERYYIEEEKQESGEEYEEVIINDEKEEHISKIFNKALVIMENQLGKENLSSLSSKDEEDSDFFYGTFYAFSEKIYQQKHLENFDNSLFKEFIDLFEKIHFDVKEIQDERRYGFGLTPDLQVVRSDENGNEVLKIEYMEEFSLTLDDVLFELFKDFYTTKDFDCKSLDEACDLMETRLGKKVLKGPDFDRMEEGDMYHDCFMDEFYTIPSNLDDEDLKKHLKSYIEFFEYMHKETQIRDDFSYNYKVINRFLFKEKKLSVFMKDYISTLEEYNEFLLGEITKEQMAILSFAFLYNPDHIDYYTAFKSGDYDDCAMYVNQNKELLVMDTVPEQFKASAENNIKVFNSLGEKEYESIIRS